MLNQHFFVDAVFSGTKKDMQQDDMEQQYVDEVKDGM